jgi:protein-glutamine gamma-glutamyltransferase
MIKIAGATVSPSSIDGQWPSGSIERDIIDTMATSEAVYDYDSQDLLQFELKLRTNIIAASKDLAQSGVKFAGFSDSRCNSD